MANTDPVTKLELVQLNLKYLDVAARLFDVIDAKGGDPQVLSKARLDYFHAQKELLDLTEGLLNG